MGRATVAGMRRSLVAVAVLLAAPGVASAAERPTAAELEATQQIALAAIHKLEAVQDSLDDAPPPNRNLGPVAGRGGIIRVTAAQMRTNQRIARAALRRAAAIEARLAGRPAPRVRPGTGDAIRLTAKQAKITRRIAVAAMRRANALAERVPYWHPPAELELPGFGGVRSADLHDAGHAAVGIMAGGRPAVAVRHGPLGRWRTATLATGSGGTGVVVGPIVRVNARGAALAAWSTTTGAIVAARRAPGGRWTPGAPVGLSALSALALDDDGTARAIGDGGKVRTQSDPGVPWAAPFADTLVPGAIALAVGGRAVAAWGVATEAPPATRITQIFTATLGPAGWGASDLAARTAPGTVASRVAVGLGENGDAALAWEVRGTSVPVLGGLHVASRPAGASWGAPAEVGPLGNAYPMDASVAVGASGATAVAWRNLGGYANAWAVTRPAGAAAFGPAVALHTPRPDDSVHVARPIVHATGVQPVVLLRLDGHGLRTDWAAGEPGALVGVPHLSSGTEQAAAVAADGAILAAGPDEIDGDLRIESRGTD